MLAVQGTVHLTPHLIEMFTVFCSAGSHSFFYFKDVGTIKLYLLNQHPLCRYVSEASHQLAALQNFPCEGMGCEMALNLSPY